MPTRRELNAATIRTLKAGPCLDCGGTYPAEAMDLDHVTAAKRGNVSDLLDLPPEILEDELTRCELVCAVCHRLRTAYRRGDAHEAAGLDAELDALLQD